MFCFLLEPLGSLQCHNPATSPMRLNAQVNPESYYQDFKFKRWSESWDGSMGLYERRDAAWPLSDFELSRKHRPKRELSGPRNVQSAAEFRFAFSCVAKFDGPPDDG